MTKLATFAALSALTVSTNAFAARGLALESIVVVQDNVRVEYGSKIRDCAILIDDDGRRAQARPHMFCDTGTDQVQTYPYSAFTFVAGDTISLCAAHNPLNCTDEVEVRAAGDLNGDGAINVIDLMIMHDAIMGEDLYAWPANDTDEIAADMNADGAINVIDILLLIRAIKAEF
jgi:hypothetical protein